LSAQHEAVRLYVGGHASRIQGEVQDLTGFRCFTAAHRPQVGTTWGPRVADVIGLLDSGAFTDPPERRLTPATALDRQLRWEGLASEKWGGTWRASALVSYDLLIDEVWAGGTRVKRRWSVAEAERAVRVTVEAAAYLASRRAAVAPRTLVLSCQGVDAAQYDECATAVLASATPRDWIGLGGWCILGRWRSWLPEFWRTLRRVLPRVARAGVGHVHIFGVLWLPALGGLAWLADQCGLTVSTDSTAPILNCSWRDKRKSGARHPYWRDNVAWWQETLANLRESEWYREPPADRGRQLALAL
jgi:hypothetical protein